jgi:ParB family chromosome partitioning protein
MGLSSLLSKDEELASVIKSKIKTRFNKGQKNVGSISEKESTTFITSRPVLSDNDTEGKKVVNFKAKDSSTQTSLPIQFLVSSKFQPRKHFDETELEELAESIKTNGVLQPILVRPLKTTGSSYEIIAGERRWRASQIAKLHEVPVIIRSFDDETALGVAMIENLQRSDLNLIEEAEGYRTLMNNFQYTQEKLSIHIGKSRSHIANVLRMLSLSKYVKRHIINDDISFGHARALVTLSENQANEVTDQIIDRHLSVRNTEKLVNNLKKVAKTGVGAKSLGRQKDANIEFIEKELTSLLGLNVVISHKANNSGHMDIFYRNLDQLQPIIDKLKWRPK